MLYRKGIRIAPDRKNAFAIFSMQVLHSHLGQDEKEKGRKRRNIEMQQLYFCIFHFNVKNLKSQDELKKKYTRNIL